ncbi:MAG: hypothetical protein DRP62_06065, partial [Planctomycetota bacterium]
KLERHCPHCGRFGGNIHSGINYRAVSDIKISSVPQRRTMVKENSENSPTILETVIRQKYNPAKVLAGLTKKRSLSHPKTSFNFPAFLLIILL